MNYKVIYKNKFIGYISFCVPLSSAHDINSYSEILDFLKTKVKYTYPNILEQSEKYLLLEIFYSKSNDYYNVIVEKV